MGVCAYQQDRAFQTPKSGFSPEEGVHLTGSHSRVCWGPRACVCSGLFKIQPQGAADRYTWKTELLANTPYLSHLVALSLQTPSSVFVPLSWQCPTTLGNSFPPAPHRHRQTEHSRQAWGSESIQAQIHSQKWPRNSHSLLTLLKVLLS